VSSTPVAWTAIEPNTAVVDAAGTQIARVVQIAGDENADIFDGFAIKTHAREHLKYVPAEIVASIAVGEVRLTISGADVAPLDDMREEVEEQIIPEKSHWYQRLAWWTTGRDR